MFRQIGAFKKVMEHFLQPFFQFLKNRLTTVLIFDQFFHTLQSSGFSGITINPISL